MMYVSDLLPGTTFRIIGVRIAGEVGKRLADMGFTEGAEGAVVRAGFLRGPFQVRIRGYDILIRRSEASGIEVEPAIQRSAAADATEESGTGSSGLTGGRRGNRAEKGPGAAIQRRGRP